MEHTVGFRCFLTWDAGSGNRLDLAPDEERHARIPIFHSFLDGCARRRRDSVNRDDF
jgi:hypothetical protein